MTAAAAAELATGGDAQVIADLAQAAAEPTELVDGRLHTLVVPDGHRVEEIHTECFEPHPDRPHDDGAFVRHSDDFIQILDRYSSVALTVWACPDEGDVIAVLNDHEAGDGGGIGTVQPGWRDWRVTFHPEKSDRWREWVAVHRQPMTQTDFAEFIEDHLPDITVPDGADLLEMAQTFQASTKVQFKSTRRLATGENEIAYSEEIDATAGRGGSMQVPSAIEISIPIYDGAAMITVPVRLRYRVREGQLRIVLVLDRPKDRERAAFDDRVNEVRQGANVDVWTGRP